MKTIDYYNHNAQEFYDRTIHADMTSKYARFLEKLSPKAHILDAGCGSGRDTLHFLKQGYRVTAFDASEEMAKMASQTTGLSVQHLYFQEMNLDEEFDGVWASASLLHISYEETPIVYKKIYNALKEEGIFFGSYKYGENFMSTADRHFWHMTEKTIVPYLEENFEILDIWKEVDNRSQVSPSPEGYWLNFLVKKKD